MRTRYIFLLLFSYLTLYCGATEQYIAIRCRQVPGGTVTATPIDSVTFSIEAIPNEGYFFYKWDDNNTTNPRVIVKSKDHDDAFIAIFEREELYSHGGVVDVAVDNVYSQQFTLSITMGTCCSFDGWSDGETDITRSYAVNEDCELFPNFLTNEMEPALTTYGAGTIDIQEGICQFTLTAVPFENYIFTQWENGSPDPVRIVDYLESTYRASFIHALSLTFQDGSWDSTAYLYDGCDIDPMPVRIPQDGNMVFCGWATAPTMTIPDVTFPFMPSQSDTLYAIYRAKPGTIVITSDSLSSDLDLLPEQAPFADVIVQYGGVLTMEETEKAKQLYFHNVTIEGGGRLVIPSGTYMAAQQLILHGGEEDKEHSYLFRFPELVVNGVLNVDNGTIYYDYLLNKTQQYPLALPVDVPLNEIRYEDGTSATYGTDYKVAIYDGDPRARGLTGWRYLDASTHTLTAGIGYTIFAKPLKYYYNGAHVAALYSRLRFPLHVGANFTETTKSVMVTPYPSHTGKDNDAGWNLVGNPYFAEFSQNLSGFGPNEEGIGLLVENDNGGYNWQGSLRYVVIPSNNGRSYYSELAQTTPLPAFKNFFVQIGTGDALLFSLADRRQNAPLHLTQEQSTNTEIMVGVKLINENHESDKMGILVNNAYTTDYEFNADLQKFGHNADVNVYAYMDNSELAYVAVDETFAANMIPVGYIANQAGQFTFALDEQFDVSQVQSVLLYDSEQKYTANLLEETYLFYTNQGINNTRFAISVLKKKDAPTSLMGVENETSLIVYDLLGRRVSIDKLPIGSIYLQGGTRYIKK